jgi:hypothetical protein
MEDERMARDRHADYSLGNIDTLSGTLWNCVAK